MGENDTNYVAIRGNITVILRLKIKRRKYRHIQIGKGLLSEDCKGAESLLKANQSCYFHSSLPNNAFMNMIIITQYICTALSYTSFHSNHKTVFWGRHHSPIIQSRKQLFWNGPRTKMVLKTQVFCLLHQCFCHYVMPPGDCIYKIFK